MAQWIGHFSGHTHDTKVEVAEAALRRAVTAFREAASSEARESKAKAVRNLAARLHTTRLKLLKARIAAAEPVAENTVRKSGGPGALRQREAKLRADGLEGILAEFGAQDVLV
jgi:hypothetical protein